MRIVDLPITAREGIRFLHEQTATLNLFNLQKPMPEIVGYQALTGIQVYMRSEGMLYSVFVQKSDYDRLRLLSKYVGVLIPKTP